MRRLLKFSFLSLSLAGCTMFDAPEGIRAPAAVAEIPPAQFSNKLRPFTTNGCNKFPHGIDYPNEYKWSLCCVQHDIAYWKGGSTEDRNEADKQLRQCIIEQGEPNTAAIVYLGVRHRDSEWTKTPDPWGYGWRINRGTSPHTPKEEVEIAGLQKDIPTDYTKVSLRSQPRLPITKVDGLTGNSCFDGALTFIHHHLRRSLRILRIEQSVERDGSGFQQLLRIHDANSSSPYEFKFYMTRENTCTQPPSAWSGSSRVELKSFSYPVND